MSSCVQNRQPLPPQLRPSPTPSPSPAEVAGPACGQPGHHQTSLRDQPGHHHILRTLGSPAPSDTGPSVEPGSHASPGLLIPGLHSCCQHARCRRLLDQPVPAASPLPLESRCPLFCLVQSRIPSLGSQYLFPSQRCPLCPHGVTAPGTSCPALHSGHYPCPGSAEGWTRGWGNSQGGDSDHSRLSGGGGLELALEEQLDLDGKRGGKGI